MPRLGLGPSVDSAASALEGGVCWMIVLLTANLKGGGVLGVEGVVSETRAEIMFCCD